MGPGMPADPDTLDDEEATRIYFEACGDHESYHIRGLDVTGSQAPAPSGEVAGRFTLAAGAAGWLARAVAEYEEGTSSPDLALPDLSAAYCAAADEDGSDTINLISAALAASIRGPILASHIEGMAHLGGGPDVTGAESALGVLRAAVEAGNMLDRQRTTPTAR